MAEVVDSDRAPEGSRRRRPWTLPLVVALAAGGAFAVRAATRQDGPPRPDPPPAGAEIVRLTGNVTNTNTPEHAGFATDVRSVWAHDLTVVDVAAVDATGAEVASEIAVADDPNGAMLVGQDPVAHQPVVLPADGTLRLTLRLARTCPPPPAIAAFRLDLLVDGHRVTRLVTPGPPVDLAGLARRADRCGR